MALTLRSVSTADERDAIQKKTFSKWINKYLVKSLRKPSRIVRDLFEDLRDGDALLTLLEILSGEHLPRERGRMRVHMLQNAQIALNFLKFKKIKLVNIRPDDVVDGNPKLTLGLIWTIILHYQVRQLSFIHQSLLLSSLKSFPVRFRSWLQSHSFVFQFIVEIHSHKSRLHSLRKFCQWILPLFSRKSLVSFTIILMRQSILDSIFSWLSHRMDDVVRRTSILCQSHSYAEKTWFFFRRNLRFFVKFLSRTRRRFPCCLRCIPSLFSWNKSPCYDMLIILK